MQDHSAYHFKSASDAFVRACAAALEGCFMLGTASITTLQEYGRFGTARAALQPSSLSKRAISASIKSSTSNHTNSSKPPRKERLFLFVKSVVEIEGGIHKWESKKRSQIIGTACSWGFSRPTIYLELESRDQERWHHNARTFLHESARAPFGRRCANRHRWSDCDTWGAM